MTAPCGILLLDKPLGLSSNAALQRVRHAYGRPRAGHVGSLDPLATGMLPICLGEATKIAGDLLEGRKGYRFEVTLGARTATGDTEGEIVERADVPAFDRARLESAARGFEGPQQQVPPMYSAIKVQGQPLYRLARQSVEVERQPRTIHIDRLAVLDFDATCVRLEAVCSKGTYIRVLAEDFARALGTCGHVTLLRREYVEPFRDQPMHTLEAVLGAAPGGLPDLLPADLALPHLPAVMLDAARADRLRHGQAVPLPGPMPEPVPGHAGAVRCRLYDAERGFFGIGETSADGSVRPRRLFNLDPS